ncbi:MAG: PIN domain-containing protein, partial [Nitrospirota bacterium]
MTEKKILVDTSAWILGFRGSAPAALQGFLKEAIDQNRVVLTPLIILELLQGCRTEMEFGDLKEKLESFESCPLDAISWKDAYRLGFSLRRK